MEKGTGTKQNATYTESISIEIQEIRAIVDQISGKISSLSGVDEVCEDKGEIKGCSNYSESVVLSLSEIRESLIHTQRNLGRFM